MVLRKFIVWFLSNFCFHATAIAALSCPAPWTCETIKLSIPYSVPSLQGTALIPSIGTKYKSTTEKIRGGFYPEKGTFKGNILYFEGLGDSMINHAPLFKALSLEGYRVIAFDYMGQGGSSGKMDRTRMEIIPMIGNIVYKKFAKDTIRFPKKTILGWSTGGLAAYMEASRNKVDNIILIAPGIVPNTIVGEGLFNFPPNEITIESLTTANQNLFNPHLDPIKPNTPLKVPHFSISLLTTAKKAQKVKISQDIKGLVLLSGDKDTYVNAQKTKEVLKRNAAHFTWVQFDDALHEIDNEKEEIRLRATRLIINFLHKSL